MGRTQNMKAMPAIGGRLIQNLWLPLLFAAVVVLWVQNGRAIALTWLAIVVCAFAPYRVFRLVRGALVPSRPGEPNPSAVRSLSLAAVLVVTIGLLMVFAIPRHMYTAVLGLATLPLIGIAVARLFGSAARDR